MISLTLFKNKYDNKTHKSMDFNTFDEFESFLYTLSKIKIASKEKAQLISPSTYKPSSLRRNINVISWAGWAALDIDDWKPEGNLKEAILKRFGKYRFICYSTASSTVNQPKFRVLFSLTSHVLADKLRQFWFALNTMGESVGDKQVKDMSRMYYIPGDYQTSTNQFIFSNHGIEIDPDVLIQEYPLPLKENTSFFEKLPEELQQKMIEHKKSQLQNTDILWTSYNNCPFWPKRLEMEYRAISSTGWYYKMYQIMVAIAGRAIIKKYPITSLQLTELCREFDNDTGGWYKNRPMVVEAERALEFVYKSVL